MNNARTCGTNALKTLLFPIITALMASPALADWVWLDADIPPQVGETMGGFGGAATLGGVELYWSGQADSLLATTWLYSGGTWTGNCGTPEGSGPCPQGVRVAPGIAAGPTGFVMFGGQDERLGTPGGTVFGDTWLFDGSDWVEVCNGAACGPDPRYAPAMAGNGTVVVMFGGFGGVPFHDDTWLFDGTDWTQVCGGGGTPCGPPALSGAAMAWDGTRFIMFGGSEFNGSDVDSVDYTWAFDPGTLQWTELCGGGSPCGPPPRTLTHLAGSGGGEIIVLGGFDLEPGLGLSDAWRWDGVQWSVLPTPWASAPAPLDGQPGCTVLPIHLTSRGNGVSGLVPVFNSPNFDSEGGMVAVYGEEDAVGTLAADPCSAPPMSVPALNSGALAILGLLLALLALGVPGRSLKRRQH